MFQKVASHYIVPDELKKGLTEDLPESQEFYAHPTKKEYPIHNKEAAALSQAEYLLDKDTIAPVDQAIIEHRFKQASQFFGGLPELVEKTVPRFEDVVTANGINLNIRCELNKQSFEKAAGELLGDMRSTASYPLCKEAAVRLLKGAEDNGIQLSPDLDEQLCKLAGLGMGTYGAVHHALLERAYPDGAANALTKLMKEAADEVAQCPDDELVPMEKMASYVDVMAQYDKLTMHQYLRPEQEVYSITSGSLKKQAEDSYQLNCGYTVSKKDVLKKAPTIRFVLKAGGCAASDDDEELLEQFSKYDGIFQKACLGL